MENAAAAIDRWDERFSPSDWNIRTEIAVFEIPEGLSPKWESVTGRPAGKWRRASSSGWRWSCRGSELWTERKATGSGTRSFPRTGLTGQKSPPWFLTRVCLISASRARAARFYEAIKARTRTRASNDRQARKSGKDGENSSRMKGKNKVFGQGRVLSFLRPVGNR